MELPIIEQIREICSSHSRIELFSRIGEHISNSDRPITRFLDLLPIPTSRLDSVRAEVFACPRIPVGLPLSTVIRIAPEYEAFLQSLDPSPLHESIFDPALIIHDLVGHILLEQPTTPYGELVACAGVAGFSWIAGADYFVNAILMFSLGLPLFDDVEPDVCEIDDNLAAECGMAWELGRLYRLRLTDSSEGVTALAYLILERWSYLSMPLMKGTG